MSRFHDPSKWQSPSFRKLKPAEKLLIFYINDVVVRDKDGVSEVIIAAGVSTHRDDTNHLFGVDDYGIWKSTDAASSWDKIPFGINDGVFQYQPMDLELSPDNKLWVSTTNNHSGSGGGTILQANDDISAFSVKHNIENGRRTELEIASNGDIYALASVNDAAAPVTIIKSTNNGSSFTPVTLPDGSATGIAANDFTRGQSFYDLVIETDPSNPNWEIEFSTTLTNLPLYLPGSSMDCIHTTTFTSGGSWSIVYTIHSITVI